MSQVKKMFLAIVAVAALTGCGGKKEGVTAAAPQQAKTAVVQTASADAVPPPAQQQAAAATPQAQAAAAAVPQPKITMLTGTVAETMNAGGYTYLKLRAATGQTMWAAVKQANVKTGSHATVAAQMTMHNFESRSLNRKFDVIVFGMLADEGSENAKSPVTLASMAGAPKQLPVASDAPQHIKGGVADVGEIKVEKAESENGRTVAEVWAGKNEVKDKQVVIRGKVVKFLAGIMGKNWIHLRDGSGSGAKGDNDITVTTLDNAAVGDVVVVTGTLRVDKDFGAGYLYPVIIEDARLSK